MPYSPPVHQPKLRPKRKRDRNPAARDPDVAKVHQSATWKKLSPRFLRSHPLCADPFGWHAKDGRHEMATQVHHIVPIRVDPSRKFDPTNLMAVCVQCHNRLDSSLRSGMNRSNSTTESQNETLERGGKG